jgi:DNA-binding response OmpR family regulator
VGFFDGAWVLVIEDAGDQAELCADICANAGLNAMTAATGVQGYVRARDLQPAIIVLDLMLPDTNGWEICRRLKTDQSTKAIPIVMLTAHDEPGNAQRAAQAGCAGYLKKPCRPADLVAAIDAALRDRESVQRARERTMESPVAEAIERLKAVFTEVPGTTLSLSEAARLSGLEPARCEPILQALVGIGFLARGRDGRFRRPSG